MEEVFGTILDDNLGRLGKKPFILELVVGSKGLLKCFHLGSTYIHSGGATQGGREGEVAWSHEHMTKRKSSLSLYKGLMTGRHTRLTLLCFVAPFLLQPGFLSKCHVGYQYFTSLK